jgi:uncharacterized protein YdaU (DUF1376 family)
VAEEKKKKRSRDFEPLPYYEWYWRDYRSNRAVQRLGYIARGLYRELLDECWAKGFIPSDTDALADICGCPKSVMKAQWKHLAQFFVRVSENTLINQRMENERTVTDRLRAERARVGRLGAERRWQTMATDGKSQQPVALDGTLLSSSSSSSSEQSKSSSNAADGAASPSGASDAQPAGDNRFPWREEIAARGNAPIGFRPPPPPIES